MDNSIEGKFAKKITPFFMQSNRPFGQERRNTYLWKGFP